MGVVIAFVILGLIIVLSLSKAKKDRQTLKEMGLRYTTQNVKMLQKGRLNDDGTVKPVTCPRCGSEQITANKKGYGIGKGIVGTAIAGPIGLVAGNIGRQKVKITCLSCGKQWKPR